MWRVFVLVPGPQLPGVHFLAMKIFFWIFSQTFASNSKNFGISISRFVLKRLMGSISNFNIFRMERLWRSFYKQDREDHRLIMSKSKEFRLSFKVRNVRFHIFETLSSTSNNTSSVPMHHRSFSR